MAKPVVFISSTCEDLDKTRHRIEAKEAALGAGFFPEMQEYWAAKDNPPLKQCLEKVEKADVLVVIVAYRFGWVPDQQPETDPAKRKSITWLECERAKDSGKDMLVFLVDDKHKWPADLCEEYTLISAVQQDKLTPELSADIQWRVNRLKEFKTWLSKDRTRATFTTPEDLGGKIQLALSQWGQGRGITGGPAPRVSDPDRYLRTLREETSHIDIRGLEVESGRAQRFPIDDLYIPLKTILADESPESRQRRKDSKEVQSHIEEHRPMDLHAALKHRKLVILGDPGAGKTTFLRRIAYGLCNSRLGLGGKTTAETLGLEDRAFPALIRLSELAEHVEGCCGREPGAPHVKNAPAWLAHFMAAANADEKAGLDREFFDQTIAQGPAVVLLDGLDETATRQQREWIVDLVTKAARHFENCRFVVTSRPPAFEGRAVLPDFTQVRIEPLEDDAIETFLTRWCARLFDNSEKQARQHGDELLKAVRSRIEIRRMARNPVMLTALAVVHWHEKRLPEQRADLYESIITWLSRSREGRPGRLPAPACINRLQELALAMQNHPEGRQVQVPRRWAAEQIVGEWAQGSERDRIETAERFLAEEEVDSGIVIRRGDDIRFWHLTFQEFLAARAIAARPEQEAKTILLTPPDGPKLYLPSWREVVLLLAGVLHKQGHRKVDAFVSAVLEGACDSGTLAGQARCAGLLGAAVRDLTAVGYRPADPRYQQLLDKVMAIFDAQKAKGIDIKVIIQAAEALGQAGDPRFTDAARADNWVTIPAGEFLMGAQKSDRSQPNYDPEADADESPVHPVTLEAYRMGRYPVTVAEFLRFIEAGGYEEERLWDTEGFGKWPAPDGWEEQLEHPTRPVVGVSWYEAAAYAAWSGCRLPTEAQWERAARRPRGRRYPWGDEKPDPSRMNYGESEIRCPTPVGIYPRGATPKGVLDMAGNVLEWCSERYGEYPKAGIKDPKGPPSGSGRVLRGGCWFHYPWFCRCSCRHFYDPDERLDLLGFRVVSLSFGLGLSE
ncbi:MAG: SUMF1/EgtB/PvdO family nonheme iron enzyme [Phycisphaerae bacterium]|nr:SUMF1/EgtB/PvdO family nonheme iron enzyme [Phycisphaerae bacterium]